MSGEPTVSAKRIVGGAVELRPARPGDVEGLIETQVDPVVRQYLGGPREEAQLRRLIARAGVSAITSTPGSYIVSERPRGEMAGTISLTRRPAELPGHVRPSGQELELTYVFRQRAWGRGLATRAATALLGAAAAELHDQPVVIVTQSANSASLELADRLGFVVVSEFEQFDATQTLLTAPLRTFQGKSTSGEQQ